MLSRTRLGVLLALSLCAFPLEQRAHGAQAPTLSCQPEWLPTFGGRPGVIGSVRSMTSFDDGGGAALFIGGAFTSAGGHPMHGIARWDGSQWSALGDGVSATGFTPEVDALLAFDDGSGSALYAGGTFTSAGAVPATNIARWNGAQWSAVGELSGGRVLCLAVFDDGSGPALYAGGEFTSAAGVVVSHIAKWSGTSWLPLGAGISHNVMTLCVFDDGSGAALYAGGLFQFAGGAAAVGVAKWDGSAWSPLGSGIGGFVYALEVFDDGSGPALFAGGQISTAGGSPARNLAKWNGASWSSLGAGPGGEVHALRAFDDGSGPALFTGGAFTSVGGVPAAGLAKWDGTQWSQVGSDFEAFNVAVLAVLDDGTGVALHVAGSLMQAGASNLGSVASWNGQQWSSFWSGGVDYQVSALATFDDGTGPALYAAGWFERAGATLLHHIGRWNGAGWNALGSGLEGNVAALAVHDDGHGEALYAAGSFTGAGTQPLHYLGRWDGSNWTPVGLGMNAPIQSLCSHADGSGRALYASGSFTIAGLHPVNHIARFDGQSWSELGSGLNGIAYAMTSFDDGGGPALFVGGTFTTAGGVNAKRIAKWNGSTWSAVGGGTDSEVLALAVHDFGSGAGLYAAGRFYKAGGLDAWKIARWDSSGWSALGGGIGVGSSGSADSLCSYGSGSSARLFVGGVFSMSDGAQGNGIAQWDGAQWSAAGTGINQACAVYALATYDDGTGPALFAGGNFASCFDSGDSYLAKWAPPSGCVALPQVLCEPGVGGVIACPCSNSPSGLDRGCDNSIASGGARLAASGSASLLADTFHLVASGELPAALSAVLQGDAIDATGLVFGQGVRCIHGVLKRLYVRNATQGALSIPNATDPSLSARSAALGDTIQPGTPRYYGVYYRDPSVAGSCAATSTYNITQQLGVLWEL